MHTKQVIVMRKDLNMRKGKMCAQAAHASMAAVLNEMSVDHDLLMSSRVMTLQMCIVKDPFYDWLGNSFTKITVGVKSEDELFDIGEAVSEICLEINFTSSM